MIKVKGILLEIIFFGLVMAVFYPGVLFAASNTQKYEVYLTQLQLYNSDTAQWETVFSGTSSALDIAAVSGSGQRVGDFISGLTVSDGNYTRAKATPNGTFTIKGSVTSGATTYYTTATTATDGDGRTVSVATTTAGNVAECTVVMLASDMTPAADGVSFGGTLNVTGGIPNKKVRVYFNLSDALVYVGGNIYPGAPTITMELENP